MNPEDELAEYQETYEQTAENIRDMPNAKQITEMVGKVTTSILEQTTNYQGKTYEEGIRAAILWVMYSGPNPLEDNKPTTPGDLLF